MPVPPAATDGQEESAVNLAPPAVNLVPPPTLPQSTWVAQLENVDSFDLVPRVSFAGKKDPVFRIGKHPPDERTDASQRSLQHAGAQRNLPDEAFNNGEWGI